jgi:hypothetical protein
LDAVEFVEQSGTEIGEEFGIHVFPSSFLRFICVANASRRPEKA